jgi:hypothetical protein
LFEDRLGDFANESSSIVRGNGCAVDAEDDSLTVEFLLCCIALVEQASNGKFSVVD